MTRGRRRAGSSSLPNPGEIQREARQYSIRRDAGWIIQPPWRLARLMDVHFAVERINQPAHLDAIGNVLRHFVLQFLNRLAL